MGAEEGLEDGRMRSKRECCLCEKRNSVMEAGRGKSRPSFRARRAQRNANQLRARVGKGRTVGGGRQVRGTRDWREGRGTSDVDSGCVGVWEWVWAWNWRGGWLRKSGWIIKNGKSGLRRRGKERPGSTGSRKRVQLPVGKERRAGLDWTDKTGRDQGSMRRGGKSQLLRNWLFRGQRHSQQFVGTI